MLSPSDDLRSMFERSLNLQPPWHVRRVEFSEQERAVHLFIEGTKTARYPCPVCGKTSKRYDEEDEERVWRHGDVVFFPCYVHCRRPRVRCDVHGIHVVEAPWARPFSRNTLAFEGYAMLLAEHMSLNEASRILRMSRTALQNLVEYWVDKAVSETALSDVFSLSLDETSFKRGQSYVTVIGDPAHRRVIGVEDGRDVEAVERFSYDFEVRGGDCNKVTQVSMDMSAAYQAAAALCFPEAKVVFDHFHVKKLILDGMDEVRREEQGKSFSRNRQAGKKLLMIPASRATDEQKAKQTSLCRSYPKTGRAFQMVQASDEVYRCSDATEAKVVIDRLTSWMMHSRLEPMKTVARSLRQHEQGILAYYLARASNAFAEGINSLIQTAKRRARGFRTFNGYRTMIFLAVGRLQLAYPRPFPE